MGYHTQFAYPAADVDEMPQPPSASSLVVVKGSLSLEDWIEWHSADLMNMWSGIVAYIEDVCLMRDMLLPYSDYYDFCEYCYENSTKIRSKNAT